MSLLSENESCFEYIQPNVCNHPQELVSHKQFPAHGDPRIFYLWIVKPFVNVNEPNSLTSAEKNQLLGDSSHTDFVHYIIDEPIVLIFLVLFIYFIRADIYVFFSSL